MVTSPILKSDVRVGVAPMEVETGYIVATELYRQLSEVRITDQVVMEVADSIGVNFGHQEVRHRPHAKPAGEAALLIGGRAPALKARCLPKFVKSEMRSRMLLMMTPHTRCLTGTPTMARGRR